MTKKSISVRQNGSLLRGPLPTRDAILKPDRILHAEPTPKTLAGGTLYTGNSKPVSDLDVEQIAQSFILAMNGFSAAERARIISAVTKSGTPGYEASGAGIGTPISDSLRHLDSARARDMKNIASMSSANKAFAAKLGSSLTQ